MFEAIEEEDRVVEKEQGLPPALLGSCNDRAKQLHASPSGKAPSFPTPLLTHHSHLSYFQAFFMFRTLDRCYLHQT